MKSKLFIAFLLMCIAGLGAKLYFVNQSYQALLASLIDISTDIGAVYFEDQRIGTSKTMMLDGQRYISLDCVREAIDNDITLSNSGQRIYIEYHKIKFPIAHEGIEMYLDENMSAINVPLVYASDVAYVNLETVCRLYDLNYVYFETTEALLIFGADTQIRTAEVSQGTTYFKTLSNGYVKYRRADTLEAVYVLGSVDEHAVCLDFEGRMVYLDGNLKTTALDFERVEAYSPSRLESSETIGLTWEAIEQYSDNDKKRQTPFAEDVNVVSPTWFNLNVNGILINSASEAYVREAHTQGIKVWGLVKNNFDPDWTSDLLANSIDRRYAIAQLLFYSAYYELDGINFDFENVYLKDQKALSSFIEEASSMLQKAGLTVSIDVTRPGGSDQWSKVYDRAALQESVDYICLMAYDEFWGSSPVSGPVASLPWTEESIQMSLETIPHEKLILGMPLYMRVWEETQNASGKYVKSGSRAITMNGFETIKSDKTLEIQWDSDSEQYYGEYLEGDSKYRIWIEDEVSLQSRLNLAESYELPGIATWRRGYGSDVSATLIGEWLAK